jgi:hypothetical protein
LTFCSIGRSIRCAGGPCGIESGERSSGVCGDFRGIQRGRGSTIVSLCPACTWGMPYFGLCVLCMLHITLASSFAGGCVVAGRIRDRLRRRGGESRASRPDCRWVARATETKAQLFWSALPGSQVAADNPVTPSSLLRSQKPCRGLTAGAARRFGFHRLHRPS